MNMDFADAMRAATRLTRAQKLVEATRVIQSALLGREPVPSEPPHERAAKGRAIDKRIIDLTPEVTGPEITPAPQADADIRSEGSRSGASRSGGPHRHHRTPAPANWPMGDVVGTLRQAKLPSFSLDALTGVRARKALKIPDGAQFSSSVLCLRCRKPKLQALCSAPSAARQTHIASDAARRHAGRR